MNSNLAPAAAKPFAPEGLERHAPHRLIWILDGTVFYALLVLLIFVAIPYGSAESWWEAFFECAVFTLTLLWIVEGLLSGSWGISHRALLLPVLGLIGFALFQTLPLGTSGVETGTGLDRKVWDAISADPFETRRFALKLIALTLYGVLLARYGSRRKRLGTVIHVLIALAVASALFGILRQTTQHEAGFFLPYLKKELGYGQFINQNHFAFLMEMVLGLVLGLLVGRGVGRERLLIYAATLMPVWTALVLSGSRGGLLGMLGQLIFVALLFTILPGASRETEDERAAQGHAKGRVRQLGNSLTLRIALAACLVLAMFAGVILVGGEPVMGKLETVHSELGALNDPVRQNANRKEIWKATWQLIKAHPVAGVGFGGYWAAIPTYHDASGELTPQQAHNDYLELLASGGLIGVALGLWFLFVFIKRVRERLRATDLFCRAACFGALVGLFGVAIHSIVDFGLHITINALVFVALLVIATADCRDAEANARPFERHQRVRQSGSTARGVETRMSIGR